MARVQGRRDRRARRDDGDRGRRRRPERDDHDRAGGRPLRPRAAPPAARPRRARRGAVVLPAHLAARRRSSPRRARERLEAMVATTDGFELAERDLEIRGEGQLLGARQSGLSDLRFTRLRAATSDLLERARGCRARRCPARACSRDAVEPRCWATSEHLGRLVRIIAGDAPGRHGSRAPKGTAHAPDGRPRPRGDLQPRRPGRRRRRARPLRRLGRARHRGALARRRALRLRRVRPRRVRA